LRRCEQLDQRRRTRHTHRLARLIDVLEPAAAAVILAPADLAALGPAREQARADSLERRNRRRPRTLARLLRTHNLRTPVVERLPLQRPLDVELEATLAAVVIPRAPELPAVKHNRPP